MPSRSELQVCCSVVQCVLQRILERMLQRVLQHMLQRVLQRVLRCMLQRMLQRVLQWRAVFFPRRIPRCLIVVSVSDVTFE